MPSADTVRDRIRRRKAIREVNGCGHCMTYYCAHSRKFRGARAKKPKSTK